MIGKMIEDALIPREFAYAVHHVANYFQSLLVASGQTNHKGRTAKLNVPPVLLYCFFSHLLRSVQQHVLMNIWLRQRETRRWENTPAEQSAFFSGIIIEP